MAGGCECEHLMSWLALNDMAAPVRDRFPAGDEQWHSFVPIRCEVMPQEEPSTFLLVRIHSLAFGWQEEESTTTTCFSGSVWWWRSNWSSYSRATKMWERKGGKKKTNFKIYLLMKEKHNKIWMNWFSALISHEFHLQLNHNNMLTLCAEADKTQL